MYCCGNIIIFHSPEAEEFAGLRVLSKKESMGICFVGKRKMSDFLPQYFTPTPGRYTFNIMKYISMRVGQYTISVLVRVMVIII